MFLINTKDNRLCKPVRLLKKLREVSSDGLCASAKCYAALEVSGPIHFVWNFPAVPIEIVLARAPSGGIPLCHNTVNAIRREETVVNSLPKTIDIDRIAKVKI